MKNYLPLEKYGFEYKNLLIWCYPYKEISYTTAQNPSHVEREGIRERRFYILEKIACPSPSIPLKRNFSLCLQSLVNGMRQEERASFTSSLITL